ncbi:hypothetical protein TRFO_24873 [Tritrichomonas foetus]|uniref:Cilia- and flagella-associated protein 418 n=1 Tax=Tritrichomonas foetus TaxID=1144522 RepID=A0A1J4KBC5_9EUKA|nr:hypothetical protein TRFO_24873 [Tritrichomonas foetus]|eukprot:OHT06988.1 hypothetical protein TRFO_24873 [Tritrichomonas foetus]
MSELDESDIQLLNDLLNSDSSDPIFTDKKNNNFAGKEAINKSSNFGNQASFQKNVVPNPPSQEQSSFKDTINDFDFDSSFDSPSPRSPKGKFGDSSFDDHNHIFDSPNHDFDSFSSPKHSKQPISQKSSNEIRKCSSICLGGTDLPVGMTVDSSDPHFCSSLICISCDLKVSRYPDKRWKAGTDYLFLRNNYPDKVHQNLITATGYCAFCCQCTFCEENTLRKLSSFSSNWVCRGHKIDEII